MAAAEAAELTVKAIEEGAGGVVSRSLLQRRYTRLEEELGKHPLYTLSYGDYKGRPYPVNKALQMVLESSGLLKLIEELSVLARDAEGRITTLPEAYASRLAEAVKGMKNRDTLLTAYWVTDMGAAIERGEVGKELSFIYEAIRNSALHGVDVVERRMTTVLPSDMPEEVYQAYEDLQKYIALPTTLPTDEQALEYAKALRKWTASMKGIKPSGTTTTLGEIRNWFRKILKMKGAAPDLLAKAEEGDKRITEFIDRIGSAAERVDALTERTFTKINVILSIFGVTGMIASPFILAGVSAKPQETSKKTK